MRLLEPSVEATSAPELHGSRGAVVLRLFGGFRLAREDGEVVPVPLRKGQAVLACLACSPEAPIPREILASLFWAECDERQARQNLRQVLFKLGQLLVDGGVPILQTDKHSVWLETEALWIDVQAFEGLLAQGTPDAVAQAAALYTGDFLTGLHVQSPDFDDWRAARRTRFEDLVMRALGDLLMRQHAEGQVGRAIETGERALLIDPLREDIHREVMRLYAAQGQRTSALRQFRLCRDLLKSELGVDPEDATTELYRSILDHGPGDESVTLDSPVSSTHPLVGRQAEPSALERAFAAAAQNGCRLLLVTGEAGVGKTHLIDTFCHRVGGDRALCVQARAGPAEQGLPLAVWTNLLGEEVAAQSLQPRRQPSTERLRLYDTVVRDLRRRAADRPLVLVFDDVHWADDESLRLLAYAVRHLETRPVLFIATARPDKPADALWPIIHDLDRDGTLHRLDVPPLSREQTQELCTQVHAALGRKPPSAARISEVWSLSDGNPRIAVECLLMREDGRSTGAGGTAALPETLYRDLQHLLAEISPAARDLADVACVAGLRCPYDLLRRAAGLDDKAMQQVVQELAEAGIVSVDDQGVVFPRGRIRLALYRSLSPPRRRTLHGAVAEAIAQGQAAQPARHHRTLAHHWREAERPVEAARCDLRVGFVELDRGNHVRAGQCFRKALRAACADHDDGVVTDDIEVDARLGLAAVAEIDQDAETVGDPLKVLDTDLYALSDAGRRTAVLHGLARMCGMSGDDDGALGYARRAAAECEWGDPNPFWLPAERLLVRPPAAGAEADRVLRTLRRRQRRVRAVNLHRSEASVCAAVAVLCGLRGEFDVASAEAQSAVRRAEGVGDARLLAACLQVLGMVLTWRGKASEALEHFDRSVTAADSRCDTIRLCALYGHRGRALHAAGRYGEALRELTGALAKAGRIGTRLYGPLFTAWQADSLYQAGDVDGALRQARAARRLAAEANQPWALSIALRTLAQVLAEPTDGNLPLARRAVDQALALQRGFGPRFELPHTLSVQARVLRASLSHRVHATAV